MHERQQQVVPAIAEMRNAARIPGDISHWRRQADGPHAVPAQAYRSLRIEVEATHPPAFRHDVKQGCDRIDAEAEQRIPDAGPERFDIRPKVRQAPPMDTLQ